MTTEADRDRRQSKISLATLIVSILALITSITTPFVAYYWLQGSLRIYELKRSAFSAEGEIGTSPSNCAADIGAKGASYDLRIENSGSLPIEKVRVLIQKRLRPPKVARSAGPPRVGVKAVDPDPKIIRSLPPVPIYVEKDDRGILITFGDAISPQSLIFLTLTEFAVLDKNTDASAPAFTAAPIWFQQRASR
jgi:hypothetical protein